MPKKTTILIVILALVTGVLIFLAVRSDRTQQIVEDTFTGDEETQLEPYATMAFENPTMVLPLGTNSGTVNITIDTADKPVAGAQIELTYDPNFFTEISLAPPASPFFGTDQMVLINNINPELGRISYATGISPSGQEKTGRGTIVILNFTVNPQIGAFTQLTFLPKSSVQTLATPESVLKSTIPLQIQVSSSTQ